MNPAKMGEVPYNATELWNLDGMGLTHRNNRAVCYSPYMVTSNGILLDKNKPLEYTLTLFALQLVVIIVTTRIVYLILKPLGQPRVVAEILGGVVLGPSFLGRLGVYGALIFPLRSIMLLDTTANLGILYFMFLVGAEMDINVLKRLGRRVVILAIVCMVVPSAVGISTAYLLNHVITMFQENQSLIILGASISITAFPVLSRILADIKLANTDLGRISISAAMVTHVFAWTAVGIAIASKDPHRKDVSTHEVYIRRFIFTGCFILGCFCVVRPFIAKVTNHTSGEGLSEFSIGFILVGVTASGFIMDAVGTHPIFGAFIFGLAVPNGQLETILLERLEDFVYIILLPVFFVISGLKTDVRDITWDERTGWIIFLNVLTSVVKVVSTFLVALLYDMPVREGLSLGLLMNTSGLMGMIILNVGKTMDVIDGQVFAISTIFMLVMTCITTPAILLLYKPGKRIIFFRHRTIQGSKVETELRIQVCVHTPRNVPSMINLMDASHPTKKSPICIYALHLVELTGRASAMLAVHSATNANQPATNRSQAQSEHIINAFDGYAQNNENVMVQPLTALSPYATMHEDICNLAEDKRVTLIVLPFHKQQTVDGGMEATNPAFRNVNKNVLVNAPCSVGILIDRGFGGPSRSTTNVSLQIAVLFFGGPNDREALAYGWRMADHPGVNLTVMRFLPGEEVSKATAEDNDNDLLPVVTEDEREEQLNDEYIRDFRLKTMNDEKVTYKETAVNNGEETVTAILSMNNNHDLCVVGVGSGQDKVSPLMAGLNDWSECPELGPIGDLLASSDFETTMSVLVLQQFVGEGIQGDGMSTPGSHVDSNNQPNMRSSFESNNGSRWNS